MQKQIPAATRVLATGLWCGLMCTAANGAFAQQVTGTAVPVPKVSVTGAGTLATPSQALQADGTAAGGYKADLVSGVGPIDTQPVLDTPLSLNIAPKELIENQQFYSSYQLFNISPSTQPSWPDTRNNPSRVQLRGFQSTNNKQDGLTMDQWRLINMEDKERVEIQTGLSGFFYGWGDPAARSTMCRSGRRQAD